MVEMPFFMYISPSNSFCGPASVVKFYTQQVTLTYSFYQSELNFSRMTGTRPLIYFSIALIGWAIVVIADDPFLRISTLLQDDASVYYYAQCLLDKGPCSGDGRAIKRLLPEFITTSCARCSEKYKKIGCEILYTIQQPKFHDLWNEFLLKYDPQNMYQSNLQNFMQYCRQQSYI